MEEKKKVILVEGEKVELDEDGYKYFKESFWIEPTITVSQIQNGNDQREVINFGQIKCPNCSSNNTNEYQDCFICFDCMFKKKYENMNFRKDNSLIILNGYLTRVNKSTRLPLFFHREMLKEEIQLFSKRSHLPPFLIEVHHINQDKLDNRKKNLSIVGDLQHKEIHNNLSERKAFSTWCEKVHGYVDTMFWEEFETWKEEKSKERW